MSLVICTNRPNESIRFYSPTGEDVATAIQSLNNRDRTGVNLSTGQGVLYIYGGNRDRVWVWFAGAHRSGTLIDNKSLAHDGHIRLCIEGEMKVVPISMTVSKAMAERVALHFLTSHQLPSYGAWVGNMG